MAILIKRIVIRRLKVSAIRKSRCIREVPSANVIYKTVAVIVDTVEIGRVDLTIAIEILAAIYARRSTTRRSGSSSR